MLHRRRRIAVVPGDGIGPEVIAVGLQLLQAINQCLQLNLELIIKDWSAEKWLKEGVGLPAGSLGDLSSNYDAIYLGALGDPRISDMAHGKEILLGLRQGLDLFVNMRPIKLLDASLCVLKDQKQIDFVVMRENTEDLYTSIGGNFKKGTVDEVAIDQSVHTRKGIERIIRYAFEFAQKNHRRQVTLGDKSNAISFGGSLWQRVFKEVSKEYLTIKADHLFVDVMAMEMVRHPERFDVIVTSNLFGDILTDLGAGIVGGLGMLASANIYPDKIGLFEPVHGSAPDIAGNNQANPIAALLSAGMMLDFLSVPKILVAIEHAVHLAIIKKEVTPDLGGLRTTSEVGQFIIGETINRLFV
jgi:3-isopropylmalate dehydrogenase